MIKVIFVRLLASVNEYIVEVHVHLLFSTYGHECRDIYLLRYIYIYIYIRLYMCEYTKHIQWWQRLPEVTPLRFTYRQGKMTFSWVRIDR